MGGLYVWRVCGNVRTGALCSNGGVRRTWNDGIFDVYFNVSFFRYLCRGLDLAETGTASYHEKKRNLS